MVCPCCCTGSCETTEDCATGCVCVDGECVPATPCVPCPECEWPESRFEYGEFEDACDEGFSLRSFRSQDAYVAGGFSLPSGVTWKPGYPDALVGAGGICNYALVVDSSVVDCCYNNCENPPAPELLIGAVTEFRYRIMLVTCDEGGENAVVTDITDDAVEGVLSGTMEPALVSGCGEPFACTTSLGFYPDPEPECNPLP